MIKIFLIALMICSALADKSLHHLYWNSNFKSLISFSDQFWNYCDLKCLYLERYYPSADFLVINFKDTSSAESITGISNFGACYVKDSKGNYALWNTVAQNTFF